MTAGYLPVPDRLPGELEPRLVRSSYADVVAEKRPDGLVFDGPMTEAVRYLVALVDRAGGPARPSGSEVVESLLTTARRHLVDALNESLPQEAREQHYDLAGAVLWQATEALRFGDRRQIDHAIGHWLSWGGV